MTCFRCGSDHVVRNGKSSTGDQRFRCQSCGRTFQIAADKYIGFDENKTKLSESSKYSKMSVEELDKEVEKLTSLNQEILRDMENIKNKNNSYSIKTITKSNKNKVVAIFLLLLNIIGVAGIHRFYVGKTKTGILYLLTFGIFGLGSLYDLILILNNKFSDKDEKILYWYARFQKIIVFQTWSTHDYLKISVDYLLGKTNEPNITYKNIHSSNIVNGNNGDNSPLTVTETEQQDEMTKELIKAFQSMSFPDKMEIMNAVLEKTKK